MENKTIAERFRERFSRPMIHPDKETEVDHVISEVIHDVHEFLQSQPENKQPTWALTKILMRLEAEGLPMPIKIKHEVENGFRQFVFYWANYSFSSDSLVILDNKMRGFEEYNILNDSFEEAILKLKQLLGEQNDPS